MVLALMSEPGVGWYQACSMAVCPFLTSIWGLGTWDHTPRDGETETERERQRERETEREGDRERDRERGRQRERGRDRETERNRDRDREEEENIFKTHNRYHNIFCISIDFQPKIVVTSGLG